LEINGEKDKSGNMITLFEQFINERKTIYHFTESLDSLNDILSEDALRSGEKTNYGRGYENISFTWNPNLWDIEYMGDLDYRYKVKMCFNYDRMSKEWKFEPYDYFSEKESEQDPEEQEERVITDEMNGIIKYITKIYISSEYGRGDMEWLKNRYPEIKFHWAKRKKFKNDYNF
jgi:hypothetical protein